MISKESDLPVTRQCELLKLNRSTVYYQPRPVSMEDQKLMRCIDEMYLKRPFYGSRRLRDWLQDEGITVKASTAFDAANGTGSDLSQEAH